MDIRLFAGQGGMALHRDIIVIGASAGGFEALKKLVADFPGDLDASVFVVWHMPPDIRGLLPEVLNRCGPLHAANAFDKEEIRPGRIYVAPPDRHLLIESNTVRTTKGPRENRFRPAVDPLFRSAAFSYRQRVIGVILSGYLDDGTSGLWTVKHFGGVAVVQDPNDSVFPSMPENAIREVEVDHVVPIDQMGKLIARLASEEIDVSEVEMENERQVETEIKIAREDSAFESGVMKLGELSPYTCPDCHGVMMKLKDGKRMRFRCHTGHAYSADSLLASVTEIIEESMWDTIRGIEESIMLLNQLGEHFSEEGNSTMAMLYFQKAREAEDRTQIIRQAIMQHENLSTDEMRDQASNNNDRREVSTGN